MQDVLKKAKDIVEERQKLLNAQEQQHDEKLQAKFISMILDIFKVSNTEIPVYKVRLEKHSPKQLDCLCAVAFSTDSPEYYYRVPIDPYHFATSGYVLRCVEKEISVCPCTMDAMIRFENTLFCPDIFDLLIPTLNSLEHFYVSRIQYGIEITLDMSSH